MKAVILAGGMGTRLIEETRAIPKPLVEIGNMPILWHIMKIYDFYGIHDFVICCGYKGGLIKEFFVKYLINRSDITIDIQKDQLTFHHTRAEPWKVTLVDTGESAQTGGRLKQVEPYIDSEPFCFTYGDGLADINIRKLIDFHLKHGKKATLTAVQPQGRFGALEINDGLVTGFEEKPVGDGRWINGGFFVLSKDVISEIIDEMTIWERQPIEKLVKQNNLMAYQHHGFWHAMDSLNDKNRLDALWSSGHAPWKVW